MKKLLILLSLILLSTPANCAGTIVTYTIDAEKNATEHNNKGLLYASEKNYYGALQEYKMAISLNPKTQATATYFNNLGKVYLSIGYPELALDCFSNAITQYNLNLEFYQNLIECHKQLGQINSQLEIYQTKINSNNPFDKIMLGLLHEQMGNHKKAIIILDEFVTSEPDLIITPAVKYHIQEIVDKII